MEFRVPLDQHQLAAAQQVLLVLPVQPDLKVQLAQLDLKV
jgi:hypothetical protein